MSNTHVHPIFAKLLDSISKEPVIGYVAEEETDPCIHCDLPATDGGECCDDHKGVDDAFEIRLSRGW